MRILSINPSNNQQIHEYEPHDEKDIDKALGLAHITKTSWRETVFSERNALFVKLSELLQNQKDEIARLITNEMGKTIKESRSEIEKCAWLCKYYSENGERFLENEIIKTESSKSYVHYEPMGAILGIMPWNFPLWQVFRFAVPSLLGGNVAILKHASNVSGCALKIEELFSKAGFPIGCFQTLLIDSDAVSNIIADKRISAVTLTGSTSAGKAVAAQAGAHLKKTVLELGGSDPYIILKDADLDQAVESCVNSRLLNAGQSCIAAKRFIVEEPVYDTFLSAMKSKMESIKMGDPFSEETDIGPQAREDLRNKLHKQVQMGLIEGGRKVLGCKIPVSDGFYYPPSIVADVQSDNPLFKEEVFGPVAVVIKATDEKHAIELANDSDFGLGAAIFTSDLDKGDKLASKFIQAGSVCINDFVKSDPRLPFGGIKHSGYGRELSYFGMREFQNIKTIVLK